MIHKRFLPRSARVHFIEVSNNSFFKKNFKAVSLYNIFVYNALVENTGKKGTGFFLIQVAIVNEGIYSIIVQRKDFFLNNAVWDIPFSLIQKLWAYLKLNKGFYLDNTVKTIFNSKTMTSWSFVYFFQIDTQITQKET